MRGKQIIPMYSILPERPEAIPSKDSLYDENTYSVCKCDHNCYCGPNWIQYISCLAL